MANNHYIKNKVLLFSYIPFIFLPAAAFIF